VFKKKVILNIGAWLMLFAFVVNSVPKRFIHDRIANHKHDATTKEDSSKAYFTSNTCECEKYFTETAFTKDALSFQLWVPTASFTPTYKIMTHHYFAPQYINLRGPPTI
jgi:hypothetical protein